MEVLRELETVGSADVTGAQLAQVARMLPVTASIEVYDDAARGMAALAAAITDPACALRELGVWAEDLSPLLRALPDSHLTALDLTGNHLGHAAADLLICALRAPTCPLRALRLGENYLDHEDFRELKRVMHTLERLEVDGTAFVDVGVWAFVPPSCVRHLELSDMNVFWADLEEIYRCGLETLTIRGFGASLRFLTACLSECGTTLSAFWTDATEPVAFNEQCYVSPDLLQAIEADCAGKFPNLVELRSTFPADQKFDEVNALLRKKRLQRFRGVIRAIAQWLSPARRRAAEAVFHPKRLRAAGVFDVI